MKETKPQIGGTDYCILMSALWRDSVGGATCKDLIAILDGLEKRTLTEDDLASGLTCLEADWSHSRTRHPDRKSESALQEDSGDHEFARLRC